jgi:hypothetical protein
MEWRHQIIGPLKALEQNGGENKGIYYCGHQGWHDRNTEVSTLEEGEERKVYM